MADDKKTKKAVDDGPGSVQAPSAGEKATSMENYLSSLPQKKKKDEETDGEETALASSTDSDSVSAS